MKKEATVMRKMSSIVDTILIKSMTGEKYMFEIDSIFAHEDERYILFKEPHYLLKAVDCQHIITMNFVELLSINFYFKEQYEPPFDEYQLFKIVGVAHSTIEGINKTTTTFNFANGEEPQDMISVIFGEPGHPFLTSFK